MVRQKNENDRGEDETKSLSFSKQLQKLTEAERKIAIKISTIK